MVYPKLLGACTMKTCLETAWLLKETEIQEPYLSMEQLLKQMLNKIAACLNAQYPNTYSIILAIGTRLQEQAPSIGAHWSSESCKLHESSTVAKTICNWP